MYMILKVTVTLVITSRELSRAHEFKLVQASCIAMIPSTDPTSSHSYPGLSLTMQITLLATSQSENLAHQCYRRFEARLDLRRREWIPSDGAPLTLTFTCGLI